MIEQKHNPQVGTWARKQLFTQHTPQLQSNNNNNKQDYYTI